MRVHQSSFRKTMSISSSGAESRPSPYVERMMSGGYIVCCLKRQYLALHYRSHSSIVNSYRLSLLAYGSV